MKLETVKETRIIPLSPDAEKQINKLLKEKFLLIKILQSKDSNGNGIDALKPVFILAK